MNKNDSLTLCCLRLEDEKTIRCALALTLTAPKHILRVTHTNKRMMRWIDSLAIATQKLIAFGWKLCDRADSINLEHPPYTCVPDDFNRERRVESRDEIHVEFTDIHQQRIDCMKEIDYDSAKLAKQLRKCKILAYRIYTWAVDVVSHAKKHGITYVS